MENKFQKLVKIRFDQMKCKNPIDPWVHLPVRNQSGELVAYLKPIISEFRISAPDLPSLLAKWRNENPSLATGTFLATEQRTADWLDRLVIGRDDRLLFMVHSLKGVPLGHVGFSNFNYENQSAEIDSVLKGVKEGYSGIMTLATATLIEWGLVEFKLQGITLSVFSDNDSAIRFYERLGFVKSHLRGLYKVHLEDEEKLELAPDGYTGKIEKHYLYMRYEGAKKHVLKPL